MLRAPMLINEKDVSAASAARCLRLHHSLKLNASVQINAGWHGGKPTPKLSRVKQCINWSVNTAEKLLKATEIKNENTVPAHATASQRRCAMNKELAIIHYKATMAVLKRWLAEGIICEYELMKIDTIIANKYGLSSCSIYR